MTAGHRSSPVPVLCLRRLPALCSPSLRFSSGLKLRKVLKFHRKGPSQWGRPPVPVLPGDLGAEAALQTAAFESLCSEVPSRPPLSRFCCSTLPHQPQPTQKCDCGRPNSLSASPKVPPWMVHVGQPLLRPLSTADRSRFRHLSARTSGFGVSVSSHTPRNSPRPGCAGQRAGGPEFHTPRGRSQPRGGGGGSLMAASLFLTSVPVKGMRMSCWQAQSVREMESVGSFQVKHSEMTPK